MPERCTRSAGRRGIPRRLSREHSKTPWCAPWRLGVTRDDVERLAVNPWAFEVREDRDRHCAEDKRPHNYSVSGADCLALPKHPLGRGG